VSMPGLCLTRNVLHELLLLLLLLLQVLVH
jgi:hypothetical protein